MYQQYISDGMYSTFMDFIDNNNIAPEEEAAKTYFLHHW